MFARSCSLAAGQVRRHRPQNREQLSSSTLLNSPALSQRVLLQTSSASASCSPPPANLSELDTHARFSDSDRRVVRRSQPISLGPACAYPPKGSGSIQGRAREWRARARKRRDRVSRLALLELEQAPPLKSCSRASPQHERTTKPTCYIPPRRSHSPPFPRPSLAKKPRSQSLHRQEVANAHLSHTASASHDRQQRELDEPKGSRSYRA